MNSVTGTVPELQRSEAFVEDLFDQSASAHERGLRAPVAPRRWSTALMCVVPLLVALLGGALAFFHGMG